VSMVSKRRPSLGSVLQHACPLTVSPGQVRLALEPGSFFADQMKSDRNRRDLQRFCREFFGVDTTVVVEERAGEPGESLAVIKDKVAREAREQMRDNALSHPMVREAIRIFGAEVAGVHPVGGQGDES